MSLNKVMLIGNVGMDPEIRYLEGSSASGVQTKVATFRLATTERFRDRSGEQRENTEWHNIVAWRANADFAEKYVKKGSSLYIEGKLRTRSYTDQAGSKKDRTEVIVDNIQLLSPRRPDQDDDQPAYQQPAQPAYQPAAPAGFQPRAEQPAPAQPAYSGPQAPAADEGSDDLPF